LNVSQQEFHFWKATLASDGLGLPTKRYIDQKAAQLHKLSTQPMTEVSPSSLFNFTRANLK